MTHICVSNLAITGSDNGLSPGRRQAITKTNAGIFSIGPLGANFSEILIRIDTFSFKKMRLKVSFAKRRPFYLGLNVLRKMNLYGNTAAILPCLMELLSMSLKESKLTLHINKHIDISFIYYKVYLSMSIDNINVRNRLLYRQGKRIHQYIYIYYIHVYIYQYRLECSIWTLNKVYLKPYLTLITKYSHVVSPITGYVLKTSARLVVYERTLLTLILLVSYVDKNIERNKIGVTWDCNVWPLMKHNQLMARMPSIIIELILLVMIRFLRSRQYLHNHAALACESE